MRWRPYRRTRKQELGHAAPAPPQTMSDPGARRRGLDFEDRWLSLANAVYVRSRLGATRR